MPFGPLELFIILIILLVLFGAKRLPELGKNLGGGMREFKDSVTAKDDAPKPAALTERDVPPVTPSTQAAPTPEPARAPEPQADAPPAPRTDGD